MNVVASTADFRRAVNIATRVTERRNTIPIIGGVRCRANGSLEVVGTDLDILLAVKVPRQPGTDVSFALLNPREVVHAVHAAGSDDVAIAPRDGMVDIVSGALSVSSATLPADEFPMSLDRELVQSFGATLSMEHLTVIGRVVGAMSDEATRYYLNGLHFASIGENRVRVTATNGHQLYFVELVVPDAQGTLPDGGVIIPRKAVGLLLALGKDALDGVRLSVGHASPENDVASTAPPRSGAPVVSASLSVTGAEVRLVVRAIDGTFPDCQRVVPPVSDRQALLPSPALGRALRAISGGAKSYRAVRMDFTKPGVVNLSASHVSLSLSASIDVACNHDMRGLVIGFNGGYLASIVAAAGGGEVLLDAIDPMAPAIVRNPADTAWTGVLMPMRLP